MRIMPRSDIRDKLLLICDMAQNGRPLGTGFIVNEFGHFVTAYHVIRSVVGRRDSPKDCIRCKWKGDFYGIQYIEPLVRSGFYDAQKNAGLTTDLAMFQLIIPNKSLQVEHLPVLTFDMNADLRNLAEVSFSGFNCERPDYTEYPDFRTVMLTEYQEKTGLWRFKGKDAVWHGYSGSPVLHPQLGEVMGVVVRRLGENPQTGYVQSFHMLSNALRSYGYDCERFFRSPFSLYGRYHEGKCRAFESEEWPYASDKREFVDAFDFKTGQFPLREHWGSVKTDEYVVPFVVEQLKEHPVFCIGYYGMGKTTISKFLFCKYSSYSEQEYPVYISLSNERLSAVNSQDWDHFVAARIYRDFLRPMGSNAQVSISNKFMRQYVRHFLEHNKVVLVLDGIDEVLWDRVSLREFATVLKSLPCPYFLTSRMEFYAFFDEIGDRMEEFPHVVIELRPWQEPQWRRYVGNLHAKYAEKSYSINRLGIALENREYGTLPERPLFLKMISDLELDNDVRMKEYLPTQLRKNRAAVYHAYVRWKIKDDFVRKGVAIPDQYNKDDFTDDAFQLFRRLATVEYSASVPTKGAIGYIEGAAEYEDMYSASAFTLRDVERAASQLELLNPKFVRENILGSTFFSILRRDRTRLFRFSHKSFCEYLVGYNLANSIFGGKVDEAECGRDWDFYQTHEVSAHFEDEINRIAEVRNIEDGDKKLYLQKAFEKILLEKRDLTDYSERFEEVLYYTGKLGINSSKILDLLEKISNNPAGVHPVYYRTAHLSLSMCTSVKYCEVYVEYLADSFNGDKQAFEWNSKIQVNYYGKANMRSALRKDIDAFLGGNYLSGILPLKAFSYFTCLAFDTSEIDAAKEYLQVIQQTCEKRGYTRMERIMNRTLPILESVSAAN